MVSLNIAVLAFFILWQIADTAAIGRMESESSVDPGQMLQNSKMLWLAAHGSVLMLVVVDVLIVVRVVKTTGSPQRAASRHITPLGRGSLSTAKSPQIRNSDSSATRRSGLTEFSTFNTTPAGPVNRSLTPISPSISTITTCPLRGWADRSTISSSQSLIPAPCID